MVKERKVKNKLKISRLKELKKGLRTLEKSEEFFDRERKRMLRDREMILKKIKKARQILTLMDREMLL